MIILYIFLLFYIIGVMFDYYTLYFHMKWPLIDSLLTSLVWPINFLLYFSFLIYRWINDKSIR